VFSAEGGAGSEVHPTVREGEAGKRQDGEWHDANCSNGRELFNAEAAEVFAEERRESLLRFSEVKILGQNHLNGNTSTDGHRWKRMWGGEEGTTHKALRTDMDFQLTQRTRGAWRRIHHGLKGGQLEGSWNLSLEVAFTVQSR